MQIINLVQQILNNFPLLIIILKMKQNQSDVYQTTTEHIHPNYICYYERIRFCTG